MPAVRPAPSPTAPALLSPGSALPGLSHDTAHRTQDTICTALRVNNQSCPPQCAQFGVSGCPSPCLVASKGRHPSLPRAHLEPSCSPGLGSSDLRCQGLHPRDASAGQEAGGGAGSSPARSSDRPLLMVEEGEGGRERRDGWNRPLRGSVPGSSGRRGRGWVVKAGDPGPPALPQPCQVEGQGHHSGAPRADCNEAALVVSKMNPCRVPPRVTGLIARLQETQWTPGIGVGEGRPQRG